MESRVGLDYIVEHAEYAGKLAAALASPAAPVRKQVFELLSALCVYNAEGYARVLDTLERYKAAAGARYRLAVVVQELRGAAPDYQTALLAFINCLVISAPRLPERVRVRDELIGLGLLPILNDLRAEAGELPQLRVQLAVFDEQRESDEAQGPAGVDLNSHLDVFYAILKQVADTPQELPFLSILQHLLRVDARAPAGAAVWAAAETLVHRATLLDSREDVARLLRAPAALPKPPCACQITGLGARKPSLARALSPPPPPPPPAPRGPPPPPPPGPPPPGPPPPGPPLPPEAPTAPPAPPPLDVKLPQQETPLPKTKMKTINWNKIPNNKVIGRNNIWSLVASSHKHSPKTELDWSEIEDLFCQQATGAGSAGSSPRLGRGGGGTGTGNAGGAPGPRRDPAEITLLDGKRSLNVNIFLKQFRSSNEDIVRLVRTGAHDDIGAEKLRGLLRVLPEMDECEMLRAFRGDVARLAPAERFLLQLIQLPDYKLRIECMLLKEEWASTAGYLESAINAILVAGDDLMSSRAIQEVLYLTLIAGNFLNAGGYAGGAAGVKLSSLQKLSDIRANKPGVTLVHYVAAQAERRGAGAARWADDTRALDEAARAGVDQLLSEVRALQTRVEQLRRQISLPATPADVREQMDDFLQIAEREVAALLRDMEEVESVRIQLADFFCEDPASFKLEECFKVFSSFCAKFRAAAADNARRRAHEEQAAARRRARDAQRPRPGATSPAPTGGSACGTPLSESESLMESLLLDIKHGLGRRPLRRAAPHDASPSPDVTPTGSLRRRSRNSPAADDEGLLEFLRTAAPHEARERSAWGSLDRSWARRGPVRARLDIPDNDRDRERPASPRARLDVPEHERDRERPASPRTSLDIPERERDREQTASPRASPSTASPDPMPQKPKEWRQKIESWLRANSQEERRAAELRERALHVRLQASRRGLDIDSESDRSAALDTLSESRAEWRPAVLPDSAVVRALEAVEDVQPQAVEGGSPRRTTEDNEEMRRLRRQRSRPRIHVPTALPAQLVAITEEEKRRVGGAEIDADNVETPPAQRRQIEPARDVSAALDNADADMRDLRQEILGDGQFDRFSAARRTRRYKRTPDCAPPEDEQPAPEPRPARPSELRVRPNHTSPAPTPAPAPVPAAVPAPVPASPTTAVEELGKDEKEARLKRWQDRVKNQSVDKTPTKETKMPPYSRMRRRTSINREDVQKAIRELRSPTESPAAVWTRHARGTPPSVPPPTAVDKAATTRIPKVKSEHELNDEGFEETQSLNSESASQGASSGCNVDCDSPVPESPPAPGAPDRPPEKTCVARGHAPPRATPKRASSLRVERSASRASLRSSRSSLNSSASVATVKRAPPTPPTPAPTARPVPRAAPRAAPRPPASRSSSSGSSVAARAGAANARGSGFMRPTQASRGRGAAAAGARPVVK